MNEGFAWGAFVLDPILAPLVGPVAAAWLAAIVAVLAVLATGIALWRGLRGAWWRGLALLLIALLKPWPALRLPLTALLLATLAPVGHGAMFDGLGGRLLILNQVVHLVCVGAWLGGLLLLVLILRLSPPRALAPILRRFSGVGYGLVAGLLVSGLINVRVLTGQFWPTPLFSGFALILLIKVLLVAGMLGLALLNRLRIDNCQQRIGPLQTSVKLEWLLGVAAVAAVSLLGTLPPMLMTP